MKATPRTDFSELPAFFGPDDLRIEAFEALCMRTTAPAACEMASAIEKNIPLYDGSRLPGVFTDPDREPS